MWLENRKIIKMDIYKELINKVGLDIKSVGFNKYGDTFYVNKFRNWGLINFQKSRSSTSLATLFTINLGISSNILRQNDGIDLSKKPIIWDCHWRKRIGFILEVKQDYWWELTDRTDLDKLSSDVIGMLNNRGIPELNEHINDESLISEWLNNVGSGLTELQIYVNLTTILKLKGSDTLSEVIEAIRKQISKGCKESFEIHIKDLLE